MKPNAARNIISMFVVKKTGSDDIIHPWNFIGCSRFESG